MAASTVTPVLSISDLTPEQLAFLYKKSPVPDTPGGKFLAEHDQLDRAFAQQACRKGAYRLGKCPDGHIKEVPLKCHTRTCPTCALKKANERCVQWQPVFRKIALNAKSQAKCINACHKHHDRFRFFTIHVPINDGLGRYLDDVATVVENLADWEQGEGNAEGKHHQHLTMGVHGPGFDDQGNYVVRVLVVDGGTIDMDRFVEILNELAPGTTVPESERHLVPLGLFDRFLKDFFYPCIPQGSVARAKMELAMLDVRVLRMRGFNCTVVHSNDPKAFRPPVDEDENPAPELVTGNGVSSGTKSPGHLCNRCRKPIVEWSSQSFYDDSPPDLATVQFYKQHSVN